MHPRLHNALAKLLLGVVLTSLCVQATAAPNILVILADDAGYADFGFQGGGIHGDFADLTPNMDSLASGGALEVHFGLGQQTADDIGETAISPLTWTAATAVSPRTFANIPPNKPSPTKRR